MTVKKLLAWVAVFLVLFFAMPEILDTNVPYRLSKLFKSIVGTVYDNPNELVIPQFEEPTNERFYADHFNGENGYFVLVQPKMTPIHQAPDMSMKLAEKLAGSARVRILFKKAEKDYIGDELRHWAFVASETGKELIGWVFIDQLIFPKDFKPATNLDFNGFKYSRGEYTAEVTRFKDNLFKMNWRAKGKGLFLKGTMSGQFLEANDIIWSKKDDQDYIYDFFIKNSNVELEQEWRFNNDSITMNMFLVPE